MAFNLAKLFPPVNPQARKYGRELVQKILTQHPEGITTHTLHQRLLEEKVPEDFQFTIPPEATPQYSNNGRLKRPDVLPPNPSHPIRSKNFLKETILHEMVAMKAVSQHRVLRPKYNAEKVAELLAERGRQNRAMAIRAKSQGKTKEEIAKLMVLPKVEEVNPAVPTYVWRIYAPSVKRPATVLRDKGLAALKVAWKNYGRLVGAGEDWSHLNKRRRLARPAKVKADLLKMKARDKKRENHFSKYVLKAKEEASEQREKALKEFKTLKQWAKRAEKSAETTERDQANRDKLKFLQKTLSVRRAPITTENIRSKVLA